MIAREYYYDINGVEISGNAQNIFNEANEPNVARLMISDDVPVNTNYITVVLTTGGATITNDDSIELSTDDGLILEIDGDLNSVTEFKVVKYKGECQYKNPVYLNWLGTNGGRNFWLFDKVQDDILEVTDIGEFTSQTVDLSTDLGNGNYLGKDAVPQLVCHAVLEVADIRGLKGLLMSPDVLMLTNPDTWTTDNTDTSPPSAKPIWKRVKVLPQTFKVLETNQTHAEIELTLLLPNINIQQQ